jgi:hypothetical protein
MWRNSEVTKWLCFASTSLVLACDSKIPVSPVPTYALAQGAHGPETVDEEFARLGQSIPGFGGVFIDTSGLPVVYLTDVRDVAIAKTVLGPAFRQKGISDGGLTVLRGDYDFAQLLSWRLTMRPVMSLKGVVSTDVDEVNNRVRIGIDDPALRPQIEAVAARLNVPLSAITIIQRQPIRPLSTLRDQVRPVPAGVQIAYSTFLCTLSANVYYLDTLSFLTASHCSNVQGGVEGTSYYQSTVGAGTFVGTERADPPYVGGGSCPTGRRCRQSDALVAKYDTAVPVDYPRIAQPNCFYACSLDISWNMRFLYANHDGSSCCWVGSDVDKVGRSTSFTRGPVSETCVDLNVDADITLFCQTTVTPCDFCTSQNFETGAGKIVGHGDSGAPVYVPGWDMATGEGFGVYTGVLWGGSPDNTAFAFSPLVNIERDFGVTLKIAVNDP